MVCNVEFMNPNQLKEGVLTQHTIGIGRVTRSMVRKRAVELAVIDGRSAHDASKSDWEKAKIELTGMLPMDENETALEAAPETARWDPIPGSVGAQTERMAGEDEDAEGRSDCERLVAEGVAGAEMDLELQAAKAAIASDSSTSGTGLGTV